MVLLSRIGLGIGSGVRGSCLCCFSYLRLGIASNVRCLFIKSGVRALRIVKADPVIDDPFCLETVGDFMQIDGLLLQGSPQSSNKDVVAITAPAIHSDFDIGLGQRHDPARACILASLLRVLDLGLAIFDDGFFQRLNTEADIQRI